MQGRPVWWLGQVWAYVGRLGGCRSRMHESRCSSWGVPAYMHRSMRACPSVILCHPVQEAGPAEWWSPYAFSVLASLPISRATGGMFRRHGLLAGAALLARHALHSWPCTPDIPFILGFRVRAHHSRHAQEAEPNNRWSSSPLGTGAGAASVRRQVACALATGAAG